MIRACRAPTARLVERSSTATSTNQLTHIIRNDSAETAVPACQARTTATLSVVRSPPQSRGLCTVHACYAFLSTSSTLHAHVRSLPPASPPLRMTTVLFTDSTVLTRAADCVADHSESSQPPFRIPCAPHGNKAYRETKKAREWSSRAPAFREINLAA